MVPYHNPIPERKQRGKAEGTPESGKSDGGFGGMIGAWIQAEKMIQIALVLPCAAFICWLPGVWLDRRFHHTWIAMAGAVFGIIAGLVAAIRMAMVYANDSAGDSTIDRPDENGNGAGKSGKTGNSGTAS